MSEFPTKFTDCYDLKRLKFFTTDETGRLIVRKEEVGVPIIDFHTHLGFAFAVCPRLKLTQKSRKVELFFPYRGNPIDLDTYSASSFTPEAAKKTAYECVRQAWSDKGFVGTHNVPNILEDMDRNNITHSVLLALDFPWGLSSNTDHWFKVVEGEKRFVLYSCVHPYATRRVERAEKYIAMGAAGMKFHPAELLYRANNPRLYDLYEVCQKHGVPALFHSGSSPIAPKWQADLPAIKYFKEPVAKFKDLSFVFGHAGIEQYKEVIELGKKHDNVFMEISGQPAHRIKEMIDGIGEDRVLYGSDWPFYTQELPLAKALIATEGKPAIREKVLRKNALRFIGKYLKN